MNSTARPKVTMADVARQAGVSTATVSFVLNNTKPVTPEVHRRVEQAMHSLGYQPSHAAQMLRTGKSATLGLVIPDLTNPFFPKLAQDVEQEARALGYAVLLADSHDDLALQDELLQNLERRGVDMLLVVPAMHTSATLKAGVPVVVLDRLAGETPSVQSDKYQGGALAAQHLLNLGHRDFAILAGPDRNSAPGERVRGMLDTLEAAGVSVPSPCIVFGEYSVESGRSGTQALLSSGEAFTALLAANDTLALGALSALQSTGKRVPDDISLIGFDDISWASLSSPPLTTIRQDTRELARQALHLALKGQAGQPSTVGTMLMLRASTAAPKVKGGKA